MFFFISHAVVLCHVLSLEIKLREVTKVLVVPVSGGTFCFSLLSVRVSLVLKSALGSSRE